MVLADICSEKTTRDTALDDSEKAMQGAMNEGDIRRVLALLDSENMRRWGAMNMRPLFPVLAAERIRK